MYNRNQTMVINALQTTLSHSNEPTNLSRVIKHFQSATTFQIGMAQAKVFSGEF